MSTSDPTRLAEDGQGLVCDGCGATVSLPLPISAKVWVAATKAFVREHQRCRAPIAK